MEETLNFKRNRPTIGVLAGWQLYEGIIPHTYLLSVLNGIRSAALEHECHLYLACGIGQVIGPGGMHPAWPITSPDTDFVPVGPWNTDGLIVVTPFLSEARKLYIQQLVSNGFPVVFIGSTEEGSAVVADNEGGIHLAFAHLVSHGHRRIAFIAGHENHESDSDARLKAYHSAVCEYGGATDSRLVAYGFHNQAGGRRAMQKIIESGAEFTAVLTSNDESAIGAMSTLRETGRRIPTDVAVIGFDDRPQALVQIPPLTTIYCPMFELGYRALGLLILHIKEPLRKIEVIREPTRLITRQSCGCIPDDLTSNIFSSLLQRAAKTSMVSFKKALARMMVEEISTVTTNLKSEEIRDLCLKLVNAFTLSIKRGDPVRFYIKLMELIQRIETAGEDSHIWQVPVSFLHQSVSSFLMPNHPPEIYRQADEMLDQARIIISESGQRYHIRRLLKQDEMAERMGVLTAHLIAATNEAQIFTTMVEHLPDVGIKNAWIAFFESKNDDPVAESFLPAGQGTGPDNVHFSTRQFPPPELYLKDKPLHLALLPLIFQQEVLGFVVFDASNLAPCASIVRQLAAAFKSARLHAQVIELSLTDSLTGLRNRRYFELFLQAEVIRSQRYGRDLSVIMIDLDHFKKYNDAFGHPAGDEALQQVAEGIRFGARRGLDIVARFGGEEFIVILPETGAKSAKEVAEKIRNSIASLRNVKCCITVSIGVAAVQGDECKAEELVRQADRALYQAKHRGRNRVCTFEGERIE
jgi:diguanylate cyclase (GGDEF)-like protein